MMSSRDEERDEEIVRLHSWGYTNYAIADELGCNEKTVRNVLRVEELKSALPELNLVMNILDRSILYFISGASQKWWGLLVRAAWQDDWDVDRTKRELKKLQDPNVDEDSKRNHLEVLAQGRFDTSLLREYASEALPHLSYLLKHDPEDLASVLSDIERGMVTDAIAVETLGA